MDEKDMEQTDKEALENAQRENIDELDDVSGDDLCRTCDSVLGADGRCQNEECEESPLYIPPDNDVEFDDDKDADDS